SPPRTPQSNGIAKRAIKHLMGVARSQLAKAELGDEYWFFDITDVAFKTGGMPHEYLGGETSCECLTGKPFYYDRLWTWGSERYVHQDKQKSEAGSKFHLYAKWGIIMGHDQAKLVTPVLVTFESDEHIMDFVGEREIMTLTDDEEISDTEDDFDQDFDIAVDPIPQATVANKNSTNTEEVGEHIFNLIRGNTDDAYCLMSMAGDISIGHQETSTIAEALAGPDAEHWKEAMEQEMEGQRSKGTFHEGKSLPQGRRPVKTRFIFKIKRTANGDIERFKVRPVARGFSQQEGVDYFSIFSPVVGFDLIPVVLATAVNKKWV
ncbi:unnamed protein product, partial [Choristocarpus tenellus]